MRAPRHIPVLLAEVLEALQPKDGGRFIDGTFGAGGYSSAILAAADCRVLALDRDPTAVAAGAALAEASAGRLMLAEARFSEMAAAASAMAFAPVDGVVLDIGVSSMQLDEAARGFSFMTDGPLDMRMGAAGPSAADVVNRLSEEALAEILWVYGDEKRSRRIAKVICEVRDGQPITRTLELANAVERAIGRRPDDPRHPATRTFQALRIFVNDEMRELSVALVAAEALLRDGGRLVVVSFHSLEDRIVKDFLRERTGLAARTSRGSRHGPAGPVDLRAPSFRFVNQHPVSPSRNEVEENPRARSAKLRSAIRTAAAPWDDDATAAVPRLRARLTDAVR